MLVTMIIMGALAGITYSVGEGWTSNDGTQALQLQAVQAAARLQRIFSTAKFVGTWQPGVLSGSTSSNAASIFFWEADNFPSGNPDLTIETAEMALIQYDPTTQSIFLYQSIPYSQMTTTQLAQGGATLNDATITNSATPASFKTLSYIATRQALAGPGDHPLPGTHSVVTGLVFNVRNLTSTVALPSVEFTFTLTRGTDSVTQYGTTTLRAPTTQPN